MEPQMNADERRYEKRLEPGTAPTGPAGTPPGDFELRKDDAIASSNEQGRTFPVRPFRFSVTKTFDFFICVHLRSSAVQKALPGCTV
jgi:hypothetical protein